MNKKLFIKVAKKFFNENGLELNKENGIKLDLDTKAHDTGIRDKWSINTYVLTNTGIHEAYYRGLDKQFTVHGVGIQDLYIKDCKMESNNFIKEEQLEDLIKVLKENKAI